MNDTNVDPDWDEDEYESEMGEEDQYNDIDDDYDDE